MKKATLSKMTALVLVSCFTLSSCIGSFTLSSKFLAWNKQVSNEKVVNALLFWILTPVYGLSLTADAIVFNSIEFWTGDNPVANVGEIKEIKGEKGNYIVETKIDGYSITQGENTIDLIFDTESSTWSIVSEGISTNLLKIDKNGTADVFLASGETVNVKLDAAGVATIKELTTNTFFANK